MPNQTRRVRDLKHSLPAICRALTRQKGIKLVFQGPPRTDGNIIYSNPLPIDADEDQTMVITGDIDHECAHILYTDFAVRESIKDRVAPERCAFVKGVHNALEDTFIERREGEEYLGCRETLARSAEIMEERGEIEVVGADRPGQALRQYIDAWGRVNVLGQKLETTLEGCEAVLPELIGEAGMIRLQGLLASHLYSVDSTQKTLGLALRVERLLEELEQEDKEKRGKEGKPNTDGNGGQSGPKASQGSQSGPSPSQGDGQLGGQSPGNGSTSAAAGAILDDKGEHTPLVDRRKASDNAQAEAAARGSFCAGEGGSMARGSDIDAYRQTQSRTAGATRELQRRLVAEYQTATRRRFVTTEQGRLDGRRLHRALMGDPRIHRERVKRDLPFPAVSLVLDASGSMRGEKIMLAKQALIAVAEANRQLNIKTEVLAFGPPQVVKPFDMDLSTKARAAIGGIRTGGGTPTAEALWLAGNRLAARRETRKLLLLITDGLPNHVDNTVHVAQMLQRSGIELYGIGIGCDAIHRICRHARVLPNPSAIAETVVSAVRERLLHAA